MKKKNATLVEVFDCLNAGGKAWAIEDTGPPFLREITLDKGALWDPNSTHDWRAIGITREDLFRTDFVIEPKTSHEDQMKDSLKTAISQAGGDLRWDKLKNVTLEDALKALAPNSIRFVHVKEEK